MAASSHPFSYRYKEGPIAAFPSPEELWARSFAEENAWRDRFAAIAYPDKGGSWQIRFYQDIAVLRALEAIASGTGRIRLRKLWKTDRTRGLPPAATGISALRPAPLRGFPEVP